VVFVTVLAACGSAAPASTPADRPADRVAQLERLAIRTAAAPGYERAAFGQAWADVDRNGCDTRNDVLNRDLEHKQWRDGTRRCVVVAGDLTDPYSGATLHFVKADASAVQIDHVVALADAWASGAASWSDARRREFANDPSNLLAVDGRLNQAKGDGDASEWLPPLASAHCDYVGRLVAVKAEYGLSVTQAEHDTMASVLARCPAEAGDEQEDGPDM
jgi:hypothetical protein